MPRPSKISHVLENDKAGVPRTHNFHDFEEQRASGTIAQPTLKPGLGERLAREASTEDIVCGDLDTASFRDGANVAGDFHTRPSPRVDTSAVGVDLNCEVAPTS